jgi:hypothetical protein
MSDDSIGLMEIPLRSEGANTSIADPTITGLLDYIRFWIVDGLQQKITDPNDTQPDPLPASNVFDYDPGGNWVRNLNEAGQKAIPALYMWQTGASKVDLWTIVQYKRSRTLKLMYIAQPIFGPDGSSVFSGLASSVDAILTKSYARGRHPDYGYSGAARGTPIGVSLNLLGWKYDGGEVGVMAPIPEVSARPGSPSGGNLIDYYPALRGQLTVHELVGLEELDESDRMAEIPFSANVNDPADANGPLTVLDRYLISASEANDSGE